MECRLCGEGLESRLNLGNLYLNNFVSRRDETLPRSPLDLCVCKGCGLAQLSHSTNPDLHYRQYWYKSGINESMRAALLDVIKDATQYHKSGTWIDIGANDGYMLGLVPEFHRIGIEPAFNLLPELAQRCDQVITDYFGKHPTSQADIITSIAMFYDVEDPVGFACKVRDTLTLEGVWVNQLSYTPEMLRALAFDNICHEHLTYWNLRTLRKCYEMAGLKLIDVSFNDVNGGSIRTVACRDAAHWTAWEGELNEDEDYRDFARRVTKWRGEMLPLLYTLPDLYLYGASTKGNTLLQYLDFGRGFYGAAERNPEKWGLMTVGSWVPIVSEEEARRDASYFFVLPWHFRHAIIEREREWLGKGGRLLFPLPDIGIVV